ncbi:MAG: rod shape-determining protein MreD [Gammaproteobacteria bacterium]|nr:rod shape-determining protein MreD [Gammaproteobacteria bacterium]MXY54871.1 rod shape-determining protein MreD [Gammaproteobacteria bacterium]MYF30866.1 rod shape-determining protein MreD [Gammaproteobacteria bacterium]MYK46489.1 rod shape-determining protein MreD [Gammaproteobacteria bacterium]
MNPLRGGWLILLSLVGAMVLAVARVDAGPDWLAWLRPDWAIAVMFYWGVAAPSRVGPMSAWVAGLFFDVLLAGPLGLTGICLAFATYIAKRLEERLSLYTLWQQMAVVLGIALVIGLVKRTVLFLLDLEWSTWGVFGPALTTSLVYPAVAFVLSMAARRVELQGLSGQLGRAP